MAAALDAPAETSLRTSWTPSLAAVESLAASATAPAAADLPAALGEIAVTPLDLSGGPHSRAARTARFNANKAAAKVQAKATRDFEIAERRRRQKGEDDWVDVV